MLASPGNRLFSSLPRWRNLIPTNHLCSTEIKKKKKKKIPAVRRIAGELHVPLQEDGSTTTTKKEKVLPQIPNLFFEGETMQLSRSRTLHVSKIARSNCFLLKRRRRRPLRTGPEVFMRQHSTKQFNHFLSPGFTSELPAPRQT